MRNALKADRLKDLFLASETRQIASKKNSRSNQGQRAIASFHFLFGNNLSQSKSKRNQSDAISKFGAVHGDEIRRKKKSKKKSKKGDFEC